MRSFILFVILFLSGCGAGEYSLRVANRSDSPVTVTGGREPVTVAAHSAGTVYVSRAEGTQVVVKSGDQVLDTLQAGSSYPMVSTNEEVFYFAGDPTRLVLTDLSEFFVVDSTLDKAMAKKDPQVKLAAKMDTGAAHIVNKQFFLPPDDRVVKSVPQGTRPYRLVRVPETVPDDQLEQFLQEEFKLAASQG
ncbi:MAG: hypothetical protein KC800_09550 [Candidatus Eremiobacteraeota bacterium]|nr:hypothetical protein [Candidatus Eremiobacteraeota bacterium]